MLPVKLTWKTLTDRDQANPYTSEEKSESSSELEKLSDPSAIMQKPLTRTMQPVKPPRKALSDCDQASPYPSEEKSDSSSDLEKGSDPSWDLFKNMELK
ncbi:UNVERIFIED_CONTAM: hypothetical protein K2H54_005394 [Gekko kuhli]